MFIQWVPLFKLWLTVYFMTLCVNRDGISSSWYWLEWNLTEASSLMDPALWDKGATEALAQLHPLPVSLSQAVSMAWVSASWSSASCLYPCLWVGSWEGTQQPRALIGTKAEAFRNSSGNSGLEQVNIVSIAFHHSKWIGHRFSLGSEQRETRTPLSMCCPVCTGKGHLLSLSFKAQLPSVCNWQIKAFYLYTKCLVATELPETWDLCFCILLANTGLS